MIELDYRLAPPWDAGHAPFDLSDTDEEALRYRAFPGDQIIRVGDADFSALWGWIPLLDFAACLCNAADRLAAGSLRETIDFTENDERIALRRRGERITISCTYRNASKSIDCTVLARAAQTYAARLLGELDARFPGLRQNRDLPRWYPARHVI